MAEGKGRIVWTQRLTCVRLSGKKAGLRLNFNVPVLKDGIYRLVS
jgi:hypothetical protein